MTSDRNLSSLGRDILVTVGLGALVLAIYLQTSSFGYINLDDNNYVYQNPVVLSGLNWETVRWAFSSFHAGNWHPLTWLSLALDVELFGPNPGMQHVVNFVLHYINAVLLFFAFRRMTGAFWASAAIAAFFAVHPAHVESVAWVTERKDVLSTTFWFLAIWFYVRWTEQGKSRSLGLYLASLGMFALGLMSKPMVITLPFVLLLCDIWPLERHAGSDRRAYAQLFIEKIPFFLLSVASAVVTLFAQSSAHAVQTLTALPMHLRIQNAVLSYAKYVGAAFYPSGLALWYPYDRDISALATAAAILFLGAVTAICVWQFPQRKYLLIGWLWFVGTLVPVIGLVQVGEQAMADRYTYIPFTGLFVMVVFGARDLARTFDLSVRWLAVAGAASIAVLSVVAYVQTGYWRNHETVYTRTLEITKSNFLIEQNLCQAYIEEDRLDDAERLCLTSLEHNPEYSEALNSLGIIKFKRQDYAAAETFFKSAIDTGRAHPLTYSNLALAQILQGRPQDGEANLARAAELGGPSVPPGIFIAPLQSLIIAYLDKGEYERAVENLRRLRYLQPDHVETRIMLAKALIELRRYADAEAEAAVALQIDPNNSEAWSKLGSALHGLERRDEAATAFEKALAIRADNSEAKEGLRKVAGPSGKSR